MLLKTLLPLAIVVITVGAAPAVPKPPFHEEMKKIFSASDETWEVYKLSKQIAKPAFPSKRTLPLDGAHGRISHTFLMPVSGDHSHGEPESKALKSDGVNNAYAPIDSESGQDVRIRDNTIVPDRRAQNKPVDIVASMAATSVDKASPLTSEIKELEKSHRPDSGHDGTIVSDVVNPPGRATHKQVHQTAHDTNTVDPQDGIVGAMDEVGRVGSFAGLDSVFDLFKKKGTDAFHGQGIHVRDGVAGKGGDKPQQGRFDSPVDTLPNEAQRLHDQVPAPKRSV